jgi:diguanylate cyclase (GGDEF)-like protein
VLGDTLSSTHDLDRILRVILRTALAATGARSGAVVLLDQETATLTGQVASEGQVAPAGPGSDGGAGSGPAGDASLTVPVGRGLLGTVAATGEARLGRVTAEGPVLEEAEPTCRTFVVVPISAPGSLATHTAPWPAPPTVRGVLALYDRITGDDFDDSDLVTLRTFAGQAAVAVDNVRTHEEAQRLSLTDPLTGLWNYRHLQEVLRREVERHSRFGHTLAVLTLDLDRFKDVNDAYGHPAGDEVLVEFARRIRSEIRDIDQAFRQGGEEFVVLLPQTTAQGGAVLAQRLGAALRGTPVVISPRGAAEPIPIEVTVSIGIAVYPDHALTAQAVLDAADDALYAAKAAGRDTFRMAADPVLAEDLPVPPAARSPDDDLPHAGGEAAGDRTGGTARSGTAPGTGTGGAVPGAGGAVPGAGGAVPRPGRAGSAGSGEAKPPRQTRGR